MDNFTVLTVKSILSRNCRKPREACRNMLKIGIPPQIQAFHCIVVWLLVNHEKCYICVRAIFLTQLNDCINIHVNDKNILKKVKWYIFSSCHLQRVFFFRPEDDIMLKTFGFYFFNHFLALYIFLS